MNNSQILARRAKFNQACQMQAEACAALGSPFTAQLCTLMVEHVFSATKLEEKLATWPGDVTYRVHSVPLRLCGALNCLARSGQAPALSALYPPHHAEKLDARFWQVLDSAVTEFEPQILAQLEFTPQTNEVRRANALMPALMMLANKFDSPIALYELGASAGLNLALDQFAYQWGDHHCGPKTAPFTLSPTWDGPVPPPAHIKIATRKGCDLNPLNMALPQDEDRLLSYIWPDQIERVARTQQAAQLVRNLNIELLACDAADWLQTQLAHRQQGQVHVVYNTVAFQYFPPSVQEKIQSLLQHYGQHADVATPLAWLQLEHDGQKPGFAVTLQIWPENSPVELGRADAHGRWVNWHRRAL